MKKTILLVVVSILCVTFFVYGLIQQKSSEELAILLVKKEQKFRLQENVMVEMQAKVDSLKNEIDVLKKIRE